MPAPEPPPVRAAEATWWLPRASAVFCASTATFGVLALAGWWLGLPFLRSLGWPIEMQPNAAVGLFAMGAAALLVQAGPRGRRAAAIVAGVVGALAAATLVEHATGLDLGIDTLLHDPGAGGRATTAPGRMNPPAATNLFAAAVVVLLFARGTPRAAVLAQKLALALAFVPLAGLVGYAYRVEPLYTLTGRTGIALPTALGLLALDAGLALARADLPPLARLLSAGAAGAFARRTAFHAIVLPVALGAVAVGASRAHLVEAPLAVALLAVALAAASFAAVLRDARVVDRLEASRDRARSEGALSREELARALQRERDARAAAEAAGRAKDEFLNTLSHELRTPLNALLGWARLLREGPDDPARLTKGLSVIERNGRALAQLVSDLLDMSRLQAGRLRVERARVELGAAVEAALEAVAPAAAAKHVALVRTIGAAPPVVGDAARLEQIAWNVLANAVKFTPPGGRVEATVRAGDGTAVLEVRDTGAGIPPEFLPRLFDRFTQADGSAARRHGGLGLGLAISRQLVLRHGGRIEAESPGAGGGATFRVILPAAAPLAPAPGPRGRHDLGGAAVLVVDDEPDARELMLQLLASWNAVVRGAGSAREALDLLARERVDLLVSDIAMPGEDGYALVAELRRRERGAAGPRLPATALTAFARPEDRRRMLDAGFDAHVAKPVEPEELYAVLTALRPAPAVAAPAVPGPGGANRALVEAGPAIAAAPGRNGAAPARAAGPGPLPGV